MLRNLFINLFGYTYGNTAYITFLIFLLCIIIGILVREFVCWYYKINKVTALLESIDNKLAKFVNDNTSQPEDMHISGKEQVVGDNLDGTVEKDDTAS